MSKRYFVFIYPEHSKLKKLLDVSIFVLNPLEKWPAHVTVAGPFPNKKRVAFTKNRFDEVMFAIGAGNFFSFGSGTAYIRVGFQNEESVWKKPNFPGQRIPHLTLYDGEDLDFGRRVFEIADRARPYFGFKAGGLSLVESVSGQYRTDLVDAVDPSVLAEFDGISFSDVKSLGREERLHLFERVLRRAIDAGREKDGSPFGFLGR